MILLLFISQGLHLQPFEGRVIPNFNIFKFIVNEYLSEVAPFSPISHLYYTKLRLSEKSGTIPPIITARSHTMLARKIS